MKLLAKMLTVRVGILDDDVLASHRIADLATTSSLRSDGEREIATRRLKALEPQNSPYALPWALF
jgi:hypothetical protein